MHLTTRNDKPTTPFATPDVATATMSSVKFVQDTIRQTTESVGATVGSTVGSGVAGMAAGKAAEHAAEKAGQTFTERTGILPGTSGKHPIAEAIGTALTGGKEMAGSKGYLAVRFF